MDAKTNWSNQWPVTNPIDPRDKMPRDELLTLHMQMQEQLVKLKTDELELRKYIVKRAFPNGQEGANTQELGNGYELKANIKYNYKLDNDNKKIEDMLAELARTGNDGSFIAERLISWSPSFLLTEYRQIEEDAREGNEIAKERLKIIAKAMTITEATPTLEIKEPKKRKGNN